MVDNYKALKGVYEQAVRQASIGKGLQRHADNSNFENQVTCDINKRLGNACYSKGQAIKKIYESERLLKIKNVEASTFELLGALNYIASAIIVEQGVQK